MIRIPVPTNKLTGIGEALAERFNLDIFDVQLVGDELVIENLDESDAALVKQAITDHTPEAAPPEPAPPLTNAEIIELRKLLNPTDPII